MYKLLYIPTCEYIHGRFDINGSYTNMLTTEIIQKHTVNCYLSSAAKDCPVVIAESKEVFDLLLNGEDIYKHIAIDLSPMRWKHYIIYRNEFEIVEVDDD